MQEGELCFGNEPLLRVEAPLIQAQLIETILLNIVNFHTPQLVNSHQMINGVVKRCSIVGR